MDPLPVEEPLLGLLTLKAKSTQIARKRHQIPSTEPVTSGPYVKISWTGEGLQFVLSDTHASCIPHRFLLWQTRNILGTKLGHSIGRDDGGEQKASERSNFHRIEGRFVHDCSSMKYPVFCPRIVRPQTDGEFPRMAKPGTKFRHSLG